MTRGARWRQYWRRCYQREAELLLAGQSERLTREWARSHVSWDGALPPNGAILVAPHHAGQGIGLLALAGGVEKLGAVAASPPDEADLSGWEPSRRALVRYGRTIRERAFGPWLFRPDHGVRRALAFLCDGGYLALTGDDFYYPNLTLAPLLGRAVAVPRGASWLAQQSGKPIVPYMTVPRRGGWQLWIGSPVPPTQEGVIAAIEAGIRRAPESWGRTMAMAWRDSPVWTVGDEGGGE